MGEPGEEPTYVFQKRQKDLGRSYGLHTSGKKGTLVMSYEITEACVCCGECADECRIGAATKGESTYVIDQTLCVECGACSYVCDAGAIQHYQDGMSFPNTGNLRS
jgi:ferredoxin